MNADLARAVACLGLLLPACSSTTPTESTPTGLDSSQEILFHASHENYAWGYQNGGWFVDREGNVWSMSPASMWGAEVGEALSGGSAVFGYPKADLEDGYRSVRDSLLLHLEADELDEMSLLVRSAAAGPYSARRYSANDAGISLLGALLYDPDAGTYRRIVLSVAGDETVVNWRAN